MIIQILKINNRRYIVYACDQCGKKDIKEYQKYLLTKDFLYCSNFCLYESKKIGGVAYKLIQKKRKETCLDKYGVESSFQSESCKKKKIRTCLQRYGVVNPSQSKEIKKKKKITTLKNYGVVNPSQSKEIRQKIEETCTKRYGSKNPFQSVKCQEKSKDTLIKKYGADHPMRSDIIKSKFDFKSMWKKSHETMKKNGTYGKSKAEDLFYEFLCKKFNKNDVERQVRIHEWNIDFYVKSIKTYIQFDGVYWHGLNRKICEIEKSNVPRDKIILETYLRDKEQNEWFESNKIKLIRILDEEFRKRMKDGNFRL